VTHPRVTHSFEANVAEVTAARQFVMTAVAGWGLDPSDAGLVVDELAANALIHSESPFTVSATYEADRLVVEVTDTGPGLPSLSEVRGMSGMGLTIVDRLSHWGVRRHVAGGKTIWAELTLEPET
jgi:anti-sigma regulatory factor (Ser/Thr protein kinase)